ncbi:MAG: hypothetical protein V3U49_08355, partial [Nitrososphaerales archaeon]
GLLSTNNFFPPGSARVSGSASLDIRTLRPIYSSSLTLELLARAPIGVLLVFLRKSIFPYTYGTFGPKGECYDLLLYRTQTPISFFE